MKKNKLPKYDYTADIHKILHTYNPKSQMKNYNNNTNNN